MSGIKIIWKKTRVLKFIWKLKSRKLNLKIEILKMGILKNYLRMQFFKIKFENLKFENYLKIGVLKIKFERKWSFEN